MKYYLFELGCRKCAEKLTRRMTQFDSLPECPKCGSEMLIGNVKATAAMALDFIFEDPWGVFCHFDGRGAEPMISVSFGTHGEYVRKFSFVEIIAREVADRIGHDGNPKDANQFLRKLIDILEERQV